VQADRRVVDGALDCVEQQRFAEPNPLEVDVPAEPTDQPLSLSETQSG